MSYLALYRKYRPVDFNNVYGQEEVVTVLKNAIVTGKISHAYLFCGPRGTGKTTIAKIVARLVNCDNLIDGNPCGKCYNCLNYLNSNDIVEIDAASNNGVDEIRELRDKVNLVPSNAKYKVYIIDEVHMLTMQAFNALLKTLEEPPSHVIFILATTEPHKIPLTISSRCQKFRFSKISDDKIVDRLKDICYCENISTDDDTLYEIARLSDGGMRDAINILDQLVAYSNGNITIDDVYKVNGSVSYNDLYNLLNNIKFTKELEFDNFIEIDIDELNNMLNYKYNRFPLFERIKEMAKRIASNNYDGSIKNASSIEKRLKELLNTKLDLKYIVNDFFQSSYAKYKDKLNDKYLYYEDACIFLYIKSLLVGFNTNHVIKEIVIDEAQDYNKLQYLIIKKTFKTSNYTILGDTNQTINPYYKYDSLEELTNIFASSKYITLTKTYRSTYKIIDYTNKILGLNHITAIRNDKANDIIFRNNVNKNDFLTDINNLKGISKSIAIITKNDKEANYVYDMLKDDMDITLIDGGGHIKRDLVIVPSYVAKGLEFDSVILYTDINNKYEEKDKYLYYVACTRAQHNLIIYNNSK